MILFEEWPNGCWHHARMLCAQKRGNANELKRCARRRRKDQSRKCEMAPVRIWGQTCSSGVVRQERAPVALLDEIINICNVLIPVARILHFWASSLSPCFTHFTGLSHPSWFHLLRRTQRQWRHRRESSPASPVHLGEKCAERT